MSRKGISVAAAALHLAVPPVATVASDAQIQVAIKATDLPSEVRQPVSWHREAGLEIIVAVASGHVLFRPAKPADQPWKVCPVLFRRPHAVIRFPNGWWCVADTDNHSLVFLEDLAATGPIYVRKSIAGENLDHPHDLLWVEDEARCYILDSNGRVFRLASPRGHGEVLVLKGPRGYSRSLGWLDGAVHVIVSSRGEMVRLDDFINGQQTRRRSPEKRKVAPTGTWESTGLILNDVTRFNGWYWGTNHFSAAAGLGGDPDQGRLLRWRTWGDFEHGRWEDLSEQVPQGIVPYFLVESDNALYFAGFDRAHPERDAIFRIVLRPESPRRRNRKKLRQSSRRT